MQTQVRTHRNHGTTRVVHTLTQQILTEATALTLDHVGQGLQRTLGRTGHGLAATAVIQQAVNGFLQHTLFIANDDVRSLQFEQTFQTVITIDDSTIQIVQVGRSKASAIQRHQRTKIRRQHRQNFHHHPFRLNARALETFQNFQALGELLDLGIRRSIFEFFAQRFDFVVNVNRAKHFTNSFSTHHGLEVRSELLNLFEVFVFGEQLTALQIRHARIHHAVGFKIKHTFNVTQGDVQNHTHAGRQAL